MEFRISIRIDVYFEICDKNIALQSHTLVDLLLSSCSAFQRKSL